MKFTPDVCFYVWIAEQQLSNSSLLLFISVLLSLNQEVWKLLQLDRIFTLTAEAHMYF